MDTLRQAQQVATPGSRQNTAFQRLQQIWSEETATLSLRFLLAAFLPRLIPAGSGGRVRASLYRGLGMQVGRGTTIAGAMTFGSAPGSIQRIRMGRRCFVNSHVFIDAAAEVRLGNGVSIGHHAIIITTDHVVGPMHHRAGAVKNAPVTIGDGAWIAAGVTLLPGVTVGAGAVVAAGSVVRKDIPANVLAGGIPARVIRPLDGWEREVDQTFLHDDEGGAAHG